MRRIASAVGCSATSIYLHFDGKDALVHALIDEGMERLHDLLVAASGPGNAIERLEAHCRAYIAFGLENPEYYEIMFMLRPQSMERYPPEKYRRARRNLDLLGETLQAAADEGRATVEDARVAASAVWAALHGAVALLIARRLDVGVGHDAFIDATVDRIIAGFRK